MTKAVLIPSSGDPFLVLFVLQLWKKWWYDEVDKIYISFSTEMDSRKFKNETLSRLTEDKKVSVIYTPYKLNHEQSLQNLLSVCREDLILLLEEDAFIFTSGFVSGVFQGIENGEYDAAGSPRRSCGQEIWDVSKEKYKLNYEGLGDKGPNFWPNFFFCKRSDLLKTDLNFGPTGFQPGQYCKELDYTFKEVNAGDTFVWTSMQLRAMGLRFKEIPQNHASPTEMEDRDKKVGLWMFPHVDYIHGGSLSSGWSWNGFLLGRQPIGDKIELETRVAFWRIVSDYVDGFEEFKKEYKKGIEDITSQLDKSNIQTKYNLYKELMRL